MAGFLFSGWFRAILPKSALRVEEEAWNAYPYTKTIYRCPFIEKFTLEIETKYQCDGGEQENIFGLGDAELGDRIIGACPFSLNTCMHLCPADGSELLIVLRPSLSVHQDLPEILQGLVFFARARDRRITHLPRSCSFRAEVEQVTVGAV